MKPHYIQIGILSLLITISTTASGQIINNLSIAEPSAIAGNYPIVQPDWGLQVDSLAGTATFVMDSVDLVTNACEVGFDNIDGMIAFVDRGDCQLGKKALNSELGGAVAVVICNNAPLEGTILENPGELVEEVTIPVFFLSFELCETIIVVAEDNPIEVNLGFRCEIPEYGPEVIWGAEPGQGDFDGGLNGWTVVSEMDTSWAWTEDPIVTGSFTNVAIEGSSCNGFMSFPSDYYDTAPLPLAPPICRAPCSGSLFSPTIDLTNQQIDGLFVVFWHEWRVFAFTNTQLIVSYDDGATWPDSIGISSDPLSHNADCSFMKTPVNKGGQGEFLIPVPNYNGQASIKLQFRHIGNYYYASIDDVRLINASYLDIGLSNTSYAQAPATNIPYSMVQPIPFQVDIENRGNITATNASLTATARTPNGDVDGIYLNDIFQDQEPFCFLNQNNTFTEFHVPSPIIGTHTVDYNNTTIGDINSANDNIHFAYNITEETWLSVDRPESGTGNPILDGEFRNMWTGLLANDPRSSNFAGFDWGLAYTFYVPESGDGNVLNTVRFGINDKPGNTGDVKIYLYLWDPEEGSSLPDNRLIGEYLITPDDLQLYGVMGENGFGQKINSQPLNSGLSIAFDWTDITIKMGVANPLTGTPTLSADGYPLPLSLRGNQMYALVFVYNTEVESELEMLSNGQECTASELGTYNYAMDNLWLNGHIGTPIRTGATVTSASNPFIQNGDFVAEIQNYVWDTGFWTANQPWIEMNITPPTVSTEDISPELAASIDVFPNPVSDVLNISVNLSETSEAASFELMNVAGELVKVMQENNIRVGNYQMNVSDVTPGVYSLNIRTEAGFTSKKVVISE